MRWPILFIAVISLSLPLASCGDKSEIHSIPGQTGADESGAELASPKIKGTLCSQQKDLIRGCIARVIHPQFVDQFALLADCVKRCESGSDCKVCSSGKRYVDTGYNQNPPW